MTTCRSLTLSALAAALLIMPMLSGCRHPSFGNELEARQEELIGNEANDQIAGQYQVVSDPAVTGVVDEIAAKMIPQAKLMRGDVPFHIKVLQNDEVNAFSLPGGWIYIDTGLLTKIGSDKDVLACLIGHEAAHTILRHPAEQITNAYGKESLIDLLTQGKYEDAANIALQLDLSSHSRQDEIDADDIGLKLAHDCGYDMNGLLRFFKLVSGANSTDVQWLYTHPLNQARVRRAEQDIREISVRR